MRSLFDNTKPLLQKIHPPTITFATAPLILQVCNSLKHPDRSPMEVTYKKPMKHKKQKIMAERIKAWHA